MRKWQSIQALASRNEIKEIFDDGHRNSIWPALHGLKMSIIPNRSYVSVRPLKSIFGEARILTAPQLTTAEDFSYFHEHIPEFYFLLGVTPHDADPSKVAMNHSPRFFVDEDALVTGVKALAHLALAYMDIE